MWKNKITHKEAVDKIVELSKRDLSIGQTKKEVLSILSMTDEKEYNEVINWVVDSYEKSKWAEEKRKLQIISPLVASYTTSSTNISYTTSNAPQWEVSHTKINKTWKPWIVSLIREKDSSGKYKVYKYQVKNRGYPRHIVNEYVRQKKWKAEWVKITDSKWREYPKNKKFSAWDTVYIKVPLESNETHETLNHIAIQENYIKEQINWKINWINWAKITDSRWVEYLKDKKIPAWNTVYIKIPIWSNKFKKIIYKVKNWWTPKEIINNYANEYEKQKKSYKEMLEEFNQQHPMWKDVKMTFWFPVRSYEDIEKTLTWLTTKQIWIKPEDYEVVILLNKPNEEAEFSKDTKEKILKFKKEHPQYNIHIFEKTFNFKKDENGKDIINYWEIYKTLWDTIVYRNIQRKNIKWMDPKKIENLIIKTWAADSTDKNPRYIANQLEKYANQYWGKELIRLTWESRLPANVCKAYPLIEILEFFQRHFDTEYVGWPLNRNVWLWSYKSRIYCNANGFDPRFYKKEDVNLIEKIRKRVNDGENVSNITMHFDDGFVWAVDESCDRWIRAMVETGAAYCDKYNDKRWDSASKEKNWNTFAIDHKWEEKFKILELTKENLENNLSAFYKQRINNIFTWKTYSTKYRGKNDSKWNHIPWTWYLDNEWKNATPQERAERIAKNVVDPIMKDVLWKNDFMWLNEWDFSFWPITTEKYYDEKNKTRKFKIKSAPITFGENSITKILNIHKQKIKNWYYNYR